MTLTLSVGDNTYITRADATLYFEGAIHGAGWLSATDNVKDQALVTATRIFERQLWAGSKTSESQNLVWPRTGISDRDGNELDPNTVPQFIIDAQCELALALIKDSDLQSKANNNNNIRSVKAGSASVEFFRPTFGGRYPQVVQDLIGFLLLGSSSSVGVPFASGTDAESHFVDNTFNIGSPLK